MTDLSKTILAKSDQLNADDLAAPMTITVTEVRAADSADQPITIRYDGDQGKPFKPCKTVRRVLVRAWGPQGQEYVGRSMTLYNDPTVKWGGQPVGGIRISHLSHIDQDLTIPLTVTRGQKKPVTIKRLQVQQQQQQQQMNESDVMSLIVRAKTNAQAGMDNYRQWFSGLDNSSKAALTANEEADPDDFDAVKSVHEICKGIASRADEQNGGEA